MAETKIKLGKICLTNEGIWNIEKEYENLSLVQYNGETYLSKKNIPANTEITNDVYWAKIATRGADGNDGITPHVGENGNWFTGEIDTNIKAFGIDGSNGVGILNVEFNHDSHTVKIILSNGESYESESLQGDVGPAGVINFIPVLSLPTENIDPTAIYLLRRNDEDVEENNVYDEYFYFNGDWEKTSSKVTVDFDNYYTVDEVDDMVSELENRISSVEEDIDNVVEETKEYIDEKILNVLPSTEHAKHESVLSYNKYKIKYRGTTVDRNKSYKKLYVNTHMTVDALNEIFTEATKNKKYDMRDWYTLYAGYDSAGWTQGIYIDACYDEDNILYGFDIYYEYPDGYFSVIVFKEDDSENGIIKNTWYFEEYDPDSDTSTYIQAPEIIELQLHNLIPDNDRLEPEWDDEIGRYNDLFKNFISATPFEEIEDNDYVWKNINEIPDATSANIDDVLVVTKNIRTVEEYSGDFLYNNENVHDIHLPKNLTSDALLNVLNDRESNYGIDINLNNINGNYVGYIRIESDAILHFSYHNNPIRNVIWDIENGYNDEYLYDNGPDYVFNLGRFQDEYGNVSDLYVTDIENVMIV